MDLSTDYLNTDYLSTDYLGLNLRNPLVPSASPLSRSLDTARHLEDCGASALVMYSLFEEQLLAEEQKLERFIHQQGLGHGEADSFLPLPHGYRSSLERYLEQLEKLKAALDIPVIASLNGVSDEGWIEYARELERAGADALEINVYYVAADIDESAAEVEQRYVDILTHLMQAVSLPVAVKISAQFSSPLHFAARLAQTGVRGIALFNRPYQSDIDLDSLAVVPHLELSTPYEALERIRWTAILRSRLDVDLAVTGGFHRAGDIVKALLAGANVTHLCSALLANGPSHLKALLGELGEWLEEHEYESLRQLRGSLSLDKAIEPGAYARANYLEALDSYTPPPGVRY